MPSGRTIKLILYEVLEFSCLCVPVFVVLERFASLLRFVKLNDATAYWLVVAASIAYVTSVSLLVWVPLKYFILKSRWVFKEVTNWRPVTLAYALLCTLPCFAILVTSSKVQLDTEISYDHFSELPVSLVLFALICVDIVERIRPYCLRGQVQKRPIKVVVDILLNASSTPSQRLPNTVSDLKSECVQSGLAVKAVMASVVIFWSVGLKDSLEFQVLGPVLTHLEQVSTVSSQLQANRGANGSALRSGDWADKDGLSPSSSMAYLYSSHSDSGSLRFLWVRDPRQELFLETFVFWLDTVEMIRVAGVQEVFNSNWVFPIYTLSFFSILRVVITPNNPMLASLGVVAQDLPFLVLRICLVSVFGYVTPILYIMKNLLTCLTFVYFYFLTKLKVFNIESMF